MILIGLLTLIATAFEASLLGAEGWSPINCALLVLFTLLFTHVAIGFCQAFFGFLVSIDRAPRAAEVLAARRISRSFQSRRSWFRFFTKTSRPFSRDCA